MFSKRMMPALLWALLILALCGLPGSAIPDLTFLDWLKPDKIVHLFLFGVLSFLLLRGFEQVQIQSLTGQHPKLISFILSSVYGVVVELIQEFFIPSRTGDVFDAMADSLGALLGCWAYLWWVKRYRRTA